MPGKILGEFTWSLQMRQNRNIMLRDQYWELILFQNLLPKDNFLSAELKLERFFFGLHHPPDHLCVHSKTF